MGCVLTGVILNTTLVSQGHGDRVVVLEHMLPSLANPFVCRAITENVLQGQDTDKVQSNN